MVDHKYHKLTFISVPLISTYFITPLPLKTWYFLWMWISWTIIGHDCQVKDFTLGSLKIHFVSDYIEWFPLLITVTAWKLHFFWLYFRPYTIVGGDRCGKIAHKCGVSLDKLYYNNGFLKNGAECHKLRIGDQVCCTEWQTAN